MTETEAAGDRPGGFRPDGGDPYLLIFVESENPKTSYFLDDFKIEVSEAPAN